METPRPGAAATPSQPAPGAGPDPGPDGARTTVEARGVLCPVPIIRLARAAAQLPPGSVIELLSDDAAAEHDVPAWCRLRGHELLSTQPLPAEARTEPLMSSHASKGGRSDDKRRGEGRAAAPTDPRGEPHAPNPDPGQGLRHVIRLGGAPSPTPTTD